jgi:hypothetical protein
MMPCAGNYTLPVGGDYSLSSSGCFPCSVAFFCPGGTISDQVACPPGFLCATPGLSAPIPCPRGNKCVSPTAVPTLCDVGTFAEAGATTCALGIQSGTFVGQLGGAPSYADGLGSSAKFLQAKQMMLDSSQNMYVSDGGGLCLRKITPAGLVTTYAGMCVGQPQGALAIIGVGTEARFTNLNTYVNARSCFLATP